MKNFIKILIRSIFRFHILGSSLIILVIVIVIGSQIVNRHNFANSELHHDVMDRWGAPIIQAVPSLRFVQSGTVFNNLHTMPFEEQKIYLDTKMNYRKRGLVYFSGFDFHFKGKYQIQNSEGYDIDIVFVFPLDLQKNKILLSDLTFNVNDKVAKINLNENSDKLIWTGRLKDKEKLIFSISYKGRGLDYFTYKLDPSLPVNNFSMSMVISGGENIDYADGIVPANKTRIENDTIFLNWEYAALESGIPVGVVLPSQKSFDEIIFTMIKRSWIPFLLFYISIIVLSLYKRKNLYFYEGYLIAACYGFFFILLAYLAAFINFYAAYIISIISIGFLLYNYVKKIISKDVGKHVIYFIISFLCIPTLAVISQGYTGLIYSLEILIGLAVLMMISTNKSFLNIRDELLNITK